MNENNTSAAPGGRAFSAVRDFMGVPTNRLSEVGQAVRRILESSGPQVFSDRERLPALLRSQGLSETDIYKLCLMSSVSGFNALIDPQRPATQMELDRYAANAGETGLGRSVIMDLMAELTSAAGSAVCASALSGLPDLAREDHPAFVIPWRVYADDLRAIKSDFLKWQNGGEPLSRDRLDQLWPLVNAGIPEAQYYMGFYILHTTGEDSATGADEQTREFAVSLLHKAADAGNGPAASALADYYYFKGGSENWGLAYSYYAGFAAPVLNEQQRLAMVDIFNHRRFNRTLLKVSAVFWAVLLISVLWAPGAPVFSVMPLAGAAALILGAALLVVGVIRCRNRPYENVYYVPTGMFVIWAAYMLLRLVF